MYNKIDNDSLDTLTVTDIANILHINRNNAYALSKSLGFPSIRIGKRIIIPKKAFEEWLNQCPRVINI